jgi:hypothetical protein
MSELRHERDIVERELEALLMQVFRFELDAGGQPGTARGVFLEELNISQLYVGIFWRKLGRYTELEFREARRLGKPCLLYVRDVESEAEREPALREFLAEVDHPEAGVTARRFNHSDDLARGIRADVLRWLTRLALLGYGKTAVVEALALYRRDVHRLLRARIADQLTQARASLERTPESKPLGRRYLAYRAFWVRLGLVVVGATCISLLAAALLVFATRTTSLLLAIPSFLAGALVAIASLGLWLLAVLPRVAQLVRRSRLVQGVFGARTTFVIHWIDLDGKVRSSNAIGCAVEGIAANAPAWFVLDSSDDEALAVRPVGPGPSAEFAYAAVSAGDEATGAI